MTGYRIVTMDIAQYDDVYELWKTGEGIGLGPSDSKERIAAFLERNKAMSFVALADGRLIGAVLGGHDGRRGYIHHLAVHAEHRRRGVGRSLAGACLKHFRDIGLEKTHVFVFRDNEQALAFWQKAGFDMRKDIQVMSKNIEPEGGFP